MTKHIKYTNYTHDTCLRCWVKNQEITEEGRLKYDVDCDVDSPNNEKYSHKNLITDNIVRSSFQQTKTEYELVFSTNETEAVKKAILSYNDGPNILGLIMISMLLGVCAGKIQDRGNPFQSFFAASFDVILQLMRRFMWTTPFCLMSLIATTLASAHDIQEDFETLGIYLVTVVGGQMIVWLILVPLGYLIIKRRNPFFLYYVLAKPMLIAVTTGSTALAIPETIHCPESHLGVDNSVASFVVPFSTTIGRCGSSLYITMSCVFVVKTTTGSVGAEDLVLICILASLLSIGTPSMIGSSLVTIIIILTSLNIPPEQAAILFSTDWFLDRIRTGTNYAVQALGHVITDKLCNLSGNTSN